MNEQRIDEISKQIAGQQAGTPVRTEVYEMQELLRLALMGLHARDVGSGSISADYNPRLNDAGFMDLVCQIVKVAGSSDASASLHKSPGKQRKAAIQLQLAAEQYIEAVESVEESTQDDLGAFQDTRLLMGGADFEILNGLESIVFQGKLEIRRKKNCRNLLCDLIWVLTSIRDAIPGTVPAVPKNL